MLMLQQISVHTISFFPVGLSSSGGVLCQEGVSVRRGSLSGGVFSQEGVSVRRGSLSGGVLCQEGFSIRRGSLSGGVSIRRSSLSGGILCQEEPLKGGLCEWVSVKGDRGPSAGP